MIDTGKTTWDVCLSENAQIFLAEEMNAAQVTGSPLAPDVMRLPLEDLIAMARASLVALTGWPASEFQTASDCAHQLRSLPEATGSPVYSKALLEALAQALHMRSEISSYMVSPETPGWTAVFAEILPDLIEKLQRADGITRERWGPERIANQLRPSAARGAKVLRAAKDGHAAVHGTEEEKASRWKKYRDDYRDSLLRLGKKEAAKLDAAVRNNVATRTIERALLKK